MALRRFWRSQSPKKCSSLFRKHVNMDESKLQQQNTLCNSTQLQQVDNKHYEQRVACA
ncbi:hypothetical protein J1N35_038028 [Gossypium stocksii]|uniref:Uncharacterized protein n=1 Tax=Gossypium stocksii TaxID=47602 RepID=A0A9D3ULV6_9ROSI|nr:hypothetical protein J1N35_038028 [Gossypium stocksii]